MLQPPLKLRGGGRHHSPLLEPRPQQCPRSTVPFSPLASTVCPARLTRLITVINHQPWQAAEPGPGCQLVLRQLCRRPHGRAAAHPAPARIPSPTTSSYPHPVPCIPLVFTSVPSSLRPHPPSHCPLLPTSRIPLTSMSHTRWSLQLHPMSPCLLTATSCIPHPTSRVPHPTSRIPHPVAAEQRRMRGRHPKPPSPHGPPAAPSPCPLHQPCQSHRAKPASPGPPRGDTCPRCLEQGHLLSHCHRFGLGFSLPRHGADQASPHPQPSLCPCATVGTGSTPGTGDPHVPKHHGTPEKFDSHQTQLPPGHIQGCR